MKTFIFILVPILLSGCAAVEKHNKQQLADRAKARAERAGNSGPLYDHYVACLETGWRKSFDSGNQGSDAFNSGVDNCRYELGLLCDYYAVDSCYQDAKISNKLLFSHILENYREEHR